MLLIGFAAERSVLGWSKDDWDMSKSWKFVTSTVNAPGYLAIMACAALGSVACLPAGASTPISDQQSVAPLTKPDWKQNGVRIIKANQLDPNSPGSSSTPGMDRRTAIDTARVGAKKLWVGTVTIQPGALTGAHHHGALESVIYVVRGTARLRWGDKLEYTAEARPGDFIYVPPFVPHQELNGSATEPLDCVLVRSDGKSISINLPALQSVDKPKTVLWIDPTHPKGGF
jgi:uncharacterized RmlC-like cupin family protein